MYSHTSILLNNEEVTISSILNGAYSFKTGFEESTIRFIQQWLTGQQEFILQTSGSTGTPKKITVSREQMIASASATLQALGVQHGTALVCLPTQYVAGIMMLTRAFVGNLKIVAIEPSANPFANLRSSVSIDFAALTPYQIEAILNLNGLRNIDQTKNIIIGGAPLSHPLQQKLKSSSSAIYQTYGMTETLSHIALQRITGDHSKEHFTILPNVTVSTDERGCLVIRANYLAEPVATNDVVELLSQTTFRWLGRWDNVINSGGIKIQPEAVEKKIGELFSEHGIHNDYFVQGLPDETLGTRLVLITEGALPINDETLFHLLQSRLSKYEVPKQLFFVPQFYKTDTGKVKRTETVELCILDRESD